MVGARTSVRPAVAVRAVTTAGRRPGHGGRCSRYGAVCRLRASLGFRTAGESCNQRDGEATVAIVRVTAL